MKDGSGTLGRNDTFSLCDWYESLFMIPPWEGGRCCGSLAAFAFRRWSSLFVCMYLYCSVTLFHITRALCARSPLYPHDLNPISPLSVSSRYVKRDESTSWTNHANSSTNRKVELMWFTNELCPVTMGWCPTMQKFGWPEWVLSERWKVCIWSDRLKKVIGRRNTNREGRRPGYTKSRGDMYNCTTGLCLLV